MPIHADIEAGAYDPDDVVEASAESLQEAAAEAHALVDEISAERNEIRDNTGHRLVLEALEHTDQPHMDAIAAANLAEKAYRRHLSPGSGPGQTVAVGTAQDDEGAE